MRAGARLRAAAVAAATGRPAVRAAVMVEPIGRRAALRAAQWLIAAFPHQGAAVAVATTGRHRPRAVAATIGRRAALRAVTGLQVVPPAAGTKT